MGLGLTLLAAPAWADACSGDAAILQSVRSVMGDAARVTVRTALCEVPSGTAVEDAHPEPGGRLGRPMRFRLTSGGRPVGYAVSVVSVEVTHVRAVRAVRAGATLSDGDAETRLATVDGEILAPLPGWRDVIGQTVSRSVVPGEALTASLVRLPPAVRSGDRVVAIAIVGEVQARGTAIAQQGGRIGDVIRLINPETRRNLRGRIVAKGEVEVMHGS